MYNADNETIYVGKAKNLRKRVSSYFKDNITDIKTKFLTANVKDIKFIVTDNENEAYILEDSYIKQLQPKYNIRLKDDKRYPYICVNTEELFPRIIIARRVLNSKLKFFGPFTSNPAVHKIISIINNLYKLRRCKKFSIKTQPCLYYHIKKCDAPCINNISSESYKERINNILKILSGYTGSLIKTVENEMKRLASEEKFEEAAECRDNILALQELFNFQKIDSADIESYDVIAFNVKNNFGCCQKFVYRLGKMTNNEIYNFEYQENSFDKNELISRIIFQTYNNSLFIPSELIIESEPENRDSLEAWLSAKRGNKTIITVPQKGKKKDLIEFIKNNCLQTLEHDEIKLKLNCSKLSELKSQLNLNKLPITIHCFDISNFAGEYAVGSAVCFYNGAPQKNEYRKYKIKSVNGINDYDMMKELLLRHFNNIIENKNGIRIPELVVIDGGLQHLNAALEIIRKECGISKSSTEIISLAKREEIIFKENESQPILLDKHSQALRLLQYIRDESHRFGITYHKTLRDKNINLSELDSIKGIGSKRKEILLAHFKSIKNIKYSNPEDLCKLGGINKKLAQNIINQLNSNNS